MKLHLISYFSINRHAFINYKSVSQSPLPSGRGCSTGGLPQYDLHNTTVMICVSIMIMKFQFIILRPPVGQPAYQLTNFIIDLSHCLLIQVRPHYRDSVTQFRGFAVKTNQTHFPISPKSKNKKNAIRSNYSYCALCMHIILNYIFFCKICFDNLCKEILKSIQFFSESTPTTTFLYGAKCCRILARKDINGCGRCTCCCGAAEQMSGRCQLRVVAIRTLHEGRLWNVGTEQLQ